MCHGHPGHALARARCPWHGGRERIPKPLLELRAEAQERRAKIGAPATHLCLEVKILALRGSASGSGEPELPDSGVCRIPAAAKRPRGRILTHPQTSFRRSLIGGAAADPPEAYFPATSIGTLLPGPVLFFYSMRVYRHLRTRSDSAGSLAGLIFPHVYRYFRRSLDGGAAGGPMGHTLSLRYRQFAART